MFLNKSKVSLSIFCVIAMTHHMHSWCKFWKTRGHKMIYQFWTQFQQYDIEIKIFEYLAKKSIMNCTVKRFLLFSWETGLSTNYGVYLLIILHTKTTWNWKIYWRKGCTHSLISPNSQKISAINVQSKAG